MSGKAILRIAENNEQKNFCGGFQRNFVFKISCFGVNKLEQHSQTTIFYVSTLNSTRRYLVLILKKRQYKNPSLDKIFKTQGERDSKKTLQCPHCVVGYNDPGAFKRHVMCHEVAVDFKLHFCLQCGKDTPFKVKNKL